MIFVSVGTHEAPFDRMLEAVYGLELEEELVVQHGPSSIRSDRALEAEYLPFDEVVRHIREARAVVMHAGVGSVMIALANGKRPIVMARRHDLGEHVDDHQVELARRMSELGLATVVTDGSSLAAALEAPAESEGAVTGLPWLGTDLSEYIAEELGPPVATAGPSQPAGSAAR